MPFKSAPLILNNRKTHKSDKTTESSDAEAYVLQILYVLRAASSVRTVIESASPLLPCCFVILEGFSGLVTADKLDKYTRRHSSIPDQLTSLTKLHSGELYACVLDTYNVDVNLV